MSQTSPTPISALPTAPSTASPSNFATLADAFVAALSTLVSQTNAISTVNYNNAVDCYNNAVAALASQVAAAASATASAAASNCGVWVSGTTYAVGNCVYSPINFLSYRRKTNGAGTTDPSADPTNWAILIPSSITLSATSKTSGYTASAGDNYTQDTTSGAFSVSLPASPSVGDPPILIHDAAGTFGTNNLTLTYANSNKIEGSATDFIVDLSNFSGWLVWSGSTYGWKFL